MPNRQSRNLNLFLFALAPIWALLFTLFFAADIMTFVKTAEDSLVSMYYGPIPHLPPYPHPTVEPGIVPAPPDPPWDPNRDLGQDWTQSGQDPFLRSGNVPRSEANDEIKALIDDEISAAGTKIEEFTKFRQLGGCEREYAGIKFAIAFERLTLSGRKAEVHIRIVQDERPTVSVRPSAMVWTLRIDLRHNFTWKSPVDMPTLSVDRGKPVPVTLAFESSGGGLPFPFRVHPVVDLSYRTRTGEDRVCRHIFWKIG